MYRAKFSILIATIKVFFGIDEVVEKKINKIDLRNNGGLASSKKRARLGPIIYNTTSDLDSPTSPTTR
ncbi:hypothetical protein HI914_00204 [Erysiphe necator]|nr:hypothetical protein HI914_00204 [Erysiphe necator]